MDTWVEGDNYQRYMGRWSEPMALAFLAWVEGADGGRWLDVGCGTGALSAAIIQTCNPTAVSGVDASAAFVGAARRRLGNGPDLRVADARSLPHPRDEFDATVSGLCLNFIPDPAAAVDEMRRVTRSAGTVAAYVWDYAEGMEMIRRFWDVAIELDPTIRNLDEATRFPLCRPESLAALFAGSELDAVETTALEIPTRFSGFDDFWRPFLGGQGPAPGYVTSLQTEQQARLAAALEAALPPSADGALELTARAYAVKGVVGS